MVNLFAGASRGQIVDPDKPLLFTMARMDRIKNITGLVEWYGQSDALRQETNLLIASGYIDPNRSSDTEERAQVGENAPADGSIRPGWTSTLARRPG